MPRVRRKNVRIVGRWTEADSRFRWCPIKKLRFAKVICEERCMEKKCPIVRKKLEKQRKIKLKKERKKFERKGVTRNLLLKPEDRNGSNN